MLREKEWEGERKKRRREGRKGMDPQTDRHRQGEESE